MTMLSLETRVLPTASPVRCAVVVHGDAVLTGHDDGMVRGWASDGSSSWKETDGACSSVLQCVAVCCSVLQCVAVWCIVEQAC